MLHRVETFFTFLEKKFPFPVAETIYLCYNRCSSYYKSLAGFMLWRLNYEKHRLHPVKVMEGV